MKGLDGYRPSGFDEAVAADGSIRAASEAVLEAVLAYGAAELAADVRAEVDELGIRFESVDGDDRWHVDPVPRVIEAAEWELIAAGLAQRVRALNAFVDDVYGQRRIVAEGVLPQRVLDSAEQLEPAMAGVLPRDGVWIGIS